MGFPAESTVASGMSGIIATNTTSSRASVGNLKFANEQGGLSGRPLFDRSTVCLSMIRSVVGSDFALIGVGGIDSVKRAQEKVKAGADLIQIYTGLIYRGPGLVGELVRGLG